MKAAAAATGGAAPPSRAPSPARDVSLAGLEFIARWEGCVLHPYDDGGRPGVGNATIGVGHLIHYGPTTNADRAKFKHYTRVQALKQLHDDAEKAVAAVLRLGVPLRQNEFDALTSFVFNCGSGALFGGIARELHAGNKPAAMYVLQEWVHGPGGTIYPGLTRRRAGEAHLFLYDTYGA